jgi:hypothetical protein
MDGQSWLREVSLGSKPFGDLCRSDLEPVGAVVDRSDTHDGLDEQQRAQLEQHLSDLGYL